MPLLISETAFGGDAGIRTARRPGLVQNRKTLRPSTYSKRSHRTQKCRPGGPKRHLVEMQGFEPPGGPAWSRTGKPCALLHTQNADIERKNAVPGVRNGIWWRCRDSNPGPDQGNPVPSTCLSVIEFSSLTRYTADPRHGLRYWCLVEFPHHYFNQR